MVKVPYEKAGATYADLEALPSALEALSSDLEALPSDLEALSSDLVREIVSGRLIALPRPASRNDTQQQGSSDHVRALFRPSWRRATSARPAGA